VVVNGYQGDRIGRIFANWSIIYDGAVFENYRSSAKFGAIVFPGFALISDKKWIGLHFGRFFGYKLI
jgi:hypothetical protein